MTALAECLDPESANAYAREVFDAAGHSGKGLTCDAFFHGCALQLLAAFAHAAAIDGRACLGDIVDWSHDPDHPRPLAVLRGFYGPESGWPRVAGAVAVLRDGHPHQAWTYAELASVLALKAPARSADEA